MAQLWGGRFTKKTDQMVYDFNASIGFDRRLYRQDIEGSMAHVKMLAKQKILTEGERDRILTRYRDAVQAFLDGKTEDELSKEEAMTRALKRELKRLDQSLSTQWMALEGTRLNDYFAYGPEGGETP